jgi:predicted alpha/beta hydrolase
VQPESEQLEIRTADGWLLRADVTSPRGKPVGVAVLAHALMARRGEFSAARDGGPVRLLSERGWCVVAFDFRGHGDSQSGRREACEPCSYDDLVARDLPAVCAFGRERSGRRRPVVVLGHSLGGNVALAAQGTGAIRVDAIVALGAGMWLRELEPSRARWMVKRLTLAASVALSRRVGYFPSRALRLGSDDESSLLLEDFARFAHAGIWASADGRLDYLASLRDVRIPVLQVLTEGDRLECVPECGALFVGRCGGRNEVIRVARSDDGGSAPSSMGLVTGGRVAAVWERVEAWMRAAPVAPRPTAP